jgi:hypothetical protein
VTGPRITRVLGTPDEQHLRFIIPLAKDRGDGGKSLAPFEDGLHVGPSSEGAAYGGEVEFHGDRGSSALFGVGRSG